MVEENVGNAEQQKTEQVRVGTLYKRTGRDILRVVWEVQSEDIILSYQVDNTTPPFINVIAGTSEDPKDITQIIGIMSLEDMIKGVKAGKEEIEQTLEQVAIDELQQRYNAGTSITIQIPQDAKSKP